MVQLERQLFMFQFTCRSVYVYLSDAATKNPLFFTLVASKTITIHITMFALQSLAVVLWLILSLQSHSFKLTSRLNNPYAKTLFSTEPSEMGDLPDLPVPTAAKARIRLIVGGSSVTSAVFRAELKKELTFYRVSSQKTD